MSLTHREVRPDDVPLVCSFPQSAEELYFLFPKASWPLTPEQLERAIDARFDSTVVLDHGAVAGFANFYLREPGGACAIGNVVVAPAARGKGVGRFLIETMIGKALRDHRAAEIRISCFNENVAGLLLYAKLGFVPHRVEQRADPRGDRVALIHMRLGEAAMTAHRGR